VRVAEPTPATLTWAVRLLFAQVIGLFAVTVFLVYLDATAHATAAESAASITGFAVLMTVALGFVSYSLARRRRWARAPAIVVELLLVAIAYAILRGGGLLWVGLVLLVLGLVGAGLLLAPGTRRALGLPDGT
jgi:peptidoglycan/LPS O-acetylase OafA/YrhL